MKSFKIFFILIPIIFLGCAKNHDVKPSQSTYSKDSQISTLPPKTATNQEVSMDNACKIGDINRCTKFADLKFKDGDFDSAINAYDMNCAKQHIPSCIKMANMFEKGEGVPKDLDTALDIYTRACYGGHSRSCNDMKRLEKAAK